MTWCCSARRRQSNRGCCSGELLKAICRTHDESKMNVALRCHTSCAHWVCYPRLPPDVYDMLGVIGKEDYSARGPDQHISRQLSRHAGETFIPSPFWRKITMLALALPVKSACVHPPLVQNTSQMALPSMKPYTGLDIFHAISLGRCCPGPESIVQTSSTIPSQLLPADTLFPMVP